MADQLKPKEWATYTNAIGVLKSESSSAADAIGKLFGRTEEQVLADVQAGKPTTSTTKAPTTSTQPTEGEKPALQLVDNKKGRQFEISDLKAALKKGPEAIMSLVGRKLTAREINNINNMPTRANIVL